MSHTLIAAIGIAYIWIAIDQYFKGASGVALMFLGYSLSQIGIWLQAR
jgi:hypothetical protein